MSVGKRRSTDDPLTEHDIAERLDKAAIRLLRIMLDVRQAEGDLFNDVKASRYLSNSLDLLAGELALWGRRASDARATGKPETPTSPSV